MPVVELSAEQCLRVDELYEAVWEMCKVFTEIPGLGANIDLLGPLADLVADYLVREGYKLRFPAILFNEDTGEEYVDEYYS